MRQHAAGRPGPGLAAVVPGHQLLGLLPERGERPLGMHQVGQVRGVPVQVLAPQPEPQVSGEGAGAVAQAGWVARVPGVKLGVEHADRQLAVVAAGPPVQVVRADHRPHVIHHDHLGVHVHRGALTVLQVVDREPVAACGSAGPYHVVAGHQAGHPGDRAVIVRVARHDGDDVQVGVVPQGRREELGHWP